MRMIMADVPVGAVVRVDGDWGVVCKGYIVDCWIVGRRKLQPWTVVEMPKEQRPKRAARA